MRTSRTRLSSTFRPKEHIRPKLFITLDQDIVSTNSEISRSLSARDGELLNCNQTTTFILTISGTLFSKQASSKRQKPCSSDRSVWHRQNMSSPGTTWRYFTKGKRRPNKMQGHDSYRTVNLFSAAL